MALVEHGEWKAPVFDLFDFFLRSEYPTLERYLISDRDILV